MLDLTDKVLQNCIQVDGERFTVYTDFRVWIKFARCIRLLNENKMTDFSFLFVTEIPLDMDKSLVELIEFFMNPNPLPKLTKGEQPNDAIPYDYDIDSELIFSAFYTQYGIDLYTVDMHYHKFKALFIGLKDTKLTDVMEIRSTSEKRLQKLKTSWLIEYSKPKDETSKRLEECLGKGGNLSLIT
ncbi:MAG: Gp15 family bacteriophage protein [Oscillospiraceae bacterium]